MFVQVNKDTSKLIICCSEVMIRNKLFALDNVTEMCCGPQMCHIFPCKSRISPLAAVQVSTFHPPALPTPAGKMHLSGETKVHILLAPITLRDAPASDGDSSEICMQVHLQLTEKYFRDIKFDPVLSGVIILIWKKNICHHRCQIYWLPRNKSCAHVKMSPAELLGWKFTAQH